MIGRPLDETVNSKRAEWLRAKFMSQALKYLGVPYAKKYHEEGSKFLFCAFEMYQSLAAHNFHASTIAICGS